MLPTSTTMRFLIRLFRRCCPVLRACGYGGLLLTVSLQAGAVGVCKGTFDGALPTAEQLDGILTVHSQWSDLKLSEQRYDDPRRANLCGAILNEAVLNEVDLRGGNLSWSILRDAQLRRADLSWADLTGAILQEADFSRAVLIRTHMSRAILNRAILNWANLSGADLRRARLADAQLRGADLSLANLEGADLERADLRGADLRRANFQGANLAGVDLRGADLRGVSFRNANLTGVDLRGAELREIDLTGADLTGIDLRGADVNDVDMWGSQQAQGENQAAPPPGEPAPVRTLTNLVDEKAPVAQQTSAPPAELSMPVTAPSDLNSADEPVEYYQLDPLAPGTE